MRGRKRPPLALALCRRFPHATRVFVLLETRKM